MATYCICNKNETLRLTTSVNMRANPNVTVGNPLKVKIESSIREKASKTSHEELRLQSVFKLLDSATLSANIHTNVAPECAIDGLVQVSGAIRSRVQGEFTVRKSPHKFGGYTDRLKSINFEAQEKLYPNSDFVTTLNGVGFRDQDLGTESIYSGIDEGVYTGNIFKSSTFVTDDDRSYISPYISGTDNNLTYRFGVNPLNTKAEESFFVMRAFAPLSNNSSDSSPLYKFTNIKLLDPSGETVISYKDLSFKGDGYYATYFSEPSENRLRLNTYESLYPRVGSGYAIGNSGYSVTFNLEIDCLDDPFNEGFNAGYEEYKCDTSSNNITTLRISAIEIQNSGSLFPVDQNYLNFYTLPPLKGQRLIRHIFPKVILASGYDTTIHPSGTSRWASNEYLGSPSFQNSGEQSAGILTGYSKARYLRLEEVSNSIPDSGKLLLRFEDAPQFSTFNKVYGEFDGSFFRPEFNLTEYKTFPLQDTFYADIDEINLKVIARKAQGSRDFALDIVGYSNDRLMAVTSPSGGFLQNQVAGSGTLPSALTEETFDIDRALSDGAISEGSDLTTTTQVLNSGGDHYLLTQTPLIDSTYFKEYTIPLKIYDLFPELGVTKQFNQSSYFEKIYLDIYPIPSGADIADIRLEVYYKPGNAIPMSIVGHGQDNQLSRDTVILDVVDAQVGDPAFNRGDLSSFGTLPHTYTNADNLKTNYARRWRGVVGKEYISAFASGIFDFSFEKDEKRNPFTDGFYDFSKASGNYTISTYNEFPRSGLFSGNLLASTFDHLGWRFNSSGLLAQSSQTHRTTDWASGTHPLAGKIADAFAHTVRVSGTNGYFTFADTPTSGSFTAFIRFTPDETISGVSYNQFNSGILFSKSGDFGLRYDSGYLQAYINTSGGEVNATDTLAYSGYSYPLSVAISYGNGVLKLYTDNEIARTSFDILRASGVGTKLNTTNDLLLGANINMFVSDFGITSGNVPEFSSHQITIPDVFDQVRMVFASGDTSYQHRNSLWSYINEDADSVWLLGEFRHCSFNHEFSRLSLRLDSDYIEHKLTHDGLAYSSRTNLPLPSNIKTEDLAYHTQLENDFLRFHLKDVPNVNNSGKFYTSDLRIHKNLPRGYNFNEEAFVVETVVDADSVESITWPNGDIGPKLIVSLYSKAAVPTNETNINYGLINRHIHNIDHTCFEKISSTFDYDNLFDDSEPWADFVKTSYMQEFDHKYYSTQVDDMFLQYDIAYPVHSGSFESKIRLHAAEIKLKKALVELPTIIDNFNLYVSGGIEQRQGLNLFFISPYYSSAFNEPSGLTVYTSGGLPPSVSDSVSLYVSGEDPYQSLTMFINGYRTFSTSGEIFGSYGDNPLYGLQMFVSNSGERLENNGMNLSVINTDSIPDINESMRLVVYSTDLSTYSKNAGFNLFSKGPGVLFIDNISNGSINLTTKLTNRYLVSHRSPFNLTVRSEPGKFNSNVNLYTINAPPIDITLDQQQAINWDSSNVGQSIVVADNNYSSLSADDEIRGVTTICFGGCEYNGNCFTREIFSHGVDWNNSSCIEGGISRAQTTYTNSGTVAFNVDPSGYDNHFYGIRKYTGLIPHYPYTVTIHGYTGSTDPIDIPREIETVGYGASDEVNYSGIKHFASDPNAIQAQYGKSVAVRGNLMAIGAPNYTLVDSSGSMEDSGAVFLYRRNTAPSGYDWSSQEDQASWALEEILTLPSGFWRDYSYVETDFVGEPPDAQYLANVRKWSIGQYGRNFGYSVDIVSDPKDETNDIVVVGAPRAKFDRAFTGISVKTIKAAFIIISDNLDILEKEDEYKKLNSFIVNRNRYFKNIANPPFEIDPTYIILSATKNLGIEIEDQIEQSLSRKYPEYKSGQINRIISLVNLDANSLTIQNQIKDIFNEQFPLTSGLANSGLPAFMGVFVDNSNSLGRFAVEPAIDNFTNYFKEYTFASGLLDVNDNPISGLVIESTKAPLGEAWIYALNDLANLVLANNTIINHLDLFTTSFNPQSAPTSSGYNDIPTSGGRVYIFEKEYAKSGLFYNEDQYIWTMTQEIGLDRYLHDVKYNNERFGHAVAISKDKTKIAVGSPYDDNIGARVYEKSLTYNLDHYYENVGNWINKRVAENQDDISSIYYSLYYAYQDALKTHPSAKGAGKVIYDTLDPSGRFDLRFYHDVNFSNNIEKYSQIFSYKNGYNANGTWRYTSEELASFPRVGYSVALNDDGNLLAIGCPTDSMNQHDDSNVYHRNTKFCPEDKGIVNSDIFIPGYDSPLDEDADLVTGQFNDGGYEGTFQSYVNAGAVQLFDSRRYYPHNKVIEYGIFGNKQKSIASSGDAELYFDFISGVYDGIPFERTSFTDPEIPQDAGLIFITTPEVDSLSDEVLDNIQNWLNLGDRNLVIVGNDPTWENDGAYEYTNKIANKILDKLGSRVRLYPARNRYHALSYPSGINTISATRPVASYDTYVAATEMQASGVADIRFYDPSINRIYSHDCDEAFAFTNITCQPDIKHEGDLRAEWFDLCTDLIGRCIRTPRNIQAAYGIIPGLIPPECNVGVGCSVDPECTWGPNANNIYKAPTPVLAAAEPHPKVLKVIPAVPDSTGVRQICTTVPDPTGLDLDDTIAFRNDPSFYIYSSGNTLAYSGIYETFDTNYLDTADEGCEWFKPESLSTDYILQSTSTGFINEKTEDSVVVSVAAWCAETKFESNSVKESFVTLIASVAPETNEVLNAGGDEMLEFYNNLVSKRITLSKIDIGGRLVDHVKIAQIGGWTNRTSLKDGYKNSVLANEFETKFIGLGNRPKVFLDENVIVSSADDLISYDICWIANTDAIASEEDVAILRQWLNKGNKRLIITYGCEQDSNDPKNVSIIHADAAYQLCAKLQINIKPVYLSSKKKFATWKEDTKLISDSAPVEAGDSFSNPFNDLHPLYSNGLPKSFNNLFSDGEVQSSFASKNILLFVPIETSLTNYVAYYGRTLQRGTSIPHQVFDSKSIDVNKNYINSGWSKLSVKLPEIENSGYAIEIEFKTEDPSERTDTTYYVVTENLANKIYKPDGTFIYSQASLELNTLKSSPIAGLISRFPGSLNSFKVTSSSKTIRIGPFWGVSENASIHIAVNDMSLKDEPFNTARIVSIIGYRVPIIRVGEKRVCVDENFIIPGIESRTIEISPPRREISSNYENYCYSQDSQCLERFIIPYRQRKIPEGCLSRPAISGRTEILADASGPHDTVDGPVIVSQEFYLQNNFEAGVNRSRITVISDGSLIQGKQAYDENGNKKFANINFVNSLYPYTDFPSDTIYNTRYKITSPERGSPYKWYSATANSGLINRFINQHVSNNYVAPLPMSSFRGHESDLDPAYVVRPSEFCTCENTPPGCIKEELIIAYNSGLEISINPFSQFTKTVNGKIYRDNNQLFKDTGYDYLDFEIHNDGYPGDLFGYTVKLTNNRLFVGAPFAAYDQETILNWNSISGVPSGQVPSGVELSSYGGAGAVYMFEKTLKGGKYIRNKNSEFIRESGSLDWEYVKKFRPDSINIGQDLVSSAESIDPTILDANNYSDDELINLSKETDKFGFSIAIDSGVLVIGAPGHDFGNFVDDGQSSGLFMNKAFDNSFPTPPRKVYNLGSSGIRNSYPESGVRVGTSGIKFGATVLNNGAAFVFTEDYNYATEQTEWSFLQKITPEGANTNRQFKTLGSFPEIPFSGSENSRFGSSVSVHRNTRSDSDYCILVGSKDHPFDSGNDVEQRKENKGAAYTYDLILRKQPPALADSGAFINAKLFAESGNIKLHEEIFLNITNNNLNNQYYENTGIIFSNSNGEIFLEVSGQDKSEYQYINHRPYIAAVYGSMLAGTKISNAFRLFVEGRPNEASGNVNMMVLGSGKADVYNNVGLVTFGATGFASGVPSGLYLFNKAENPLAINDASNLYVSGANFIAFSGMPSGLGFFVSGLLPVENSGQLNVFVSG